MEEFQLVNIEGIKKMEQNDGTSSLENLGNNCFRQEPLMDAKTSG